MTAALAVLFAVIGFSLILAGAFMSEHGKTPGEQAGGLFCVGIGTLFLIGAIILGVMAFAPDLRSL